MEMHKALCEKMMEITARKNADYAGSGEDPFANFRQIGYLVQSPNIVEVGFLTRMSDKLSRVGSFISNGELKVKDESVEDTLLDLANYCILFIGYLKSKAPATPHYGETVRDYGGDGSNYRSPTGCGGVQYVDHPLDYRNATGVEKNY
jgi:hypothetical protein